MTSANKWSNPPDFEEVQTNFRELAKTKAELKLLEVDIELAGIDTKKQHPRKSYLLLEQNPELYKQHAELEAKKEELEGTARFFDYWKDMYKSYGYVNR